MMTKGEQENQTVLRNVKAPRRHGGRGAPKGSAAGFSPVPEHPWPLGSRPLPAWTRGEGGRAPGGRHILRPGLGGGDGNSLHSGRAAWRGPRAAAAEPTLTHTPLRPRPPAAEAGPSLTVSPGSGLGALGEKGEPTLGLRPAEGRCTRS